MMGADRQKRKQRGGSVDMAWEETTRRKIQTSQTINRLIAYVNGEITLEAAQVTAALGLVRKILPDLTASSNKTEVTHNYVVRAPAKVASVEEWKQQYAPQPTIQ